MFQSFKMLTIFFFLGSLLIFNGAIAAEPGTELVPPSATEEFSVAPVQSTKISKIYVNDKADAEGYASESNLTISSKVHHIYVTIELENAVADATTVGVDLTGPNLKTGGVSDIKKSGFVLKSFDFIRQKPWTVGEYQVDVALKEGEKQSVKFIIKE